MRLGTWRFFERRVIGDESNPYLIRFILFRCAAFGIFVHKFLRSDFERALHDHPWPFVTWLIGGHYWEVHDQNKDRTEESAHRRRWSVLVRPAEWRHRVVLNKEEDGTSKPVWTVMLVGRRAQRWGFYLPTGWCWWRKHNPYHGVCEEEIIRHGGGD